MVRCLRHSVFKMHKYRRSVRNPKPKMEPQKTSHCAQAPVGLLSFNLILGDDFPHKRVFCMLGSAWPIKASKILKSLYVRQRQGRVGIAARVCRTATTVHFVLKGGEVK